MSRSSHILWFLSFLSLLTLGGCVDVKPRVEGRESQAWIWGQHPEVIPSDALRTPFDGPTPSVTPSPDASPSPSSSPSSSPSTSTPTEPWATPSSTGSPALTPSPSLTPSPTEAPSPTPEPTPDADGDGVSIADGDCAPADGSIYPGAPERPFDGIDSNCNNVQDRAVTVMGVRLGERGLSTNARAVEPGGIALSNDGDVYISDKGLCRIRRVREGIIETVAGNGTCGAGEEGQPALSSAIDPGHVAYDSYNDRVYFAEPRHHRIRYLDLEAGTLHTLIGTGLRNNPVEGLPLDETNLCAPSNLATVRSSYFLYFTSGGPEEVGCHGGVWQLRVRQPLEEGNLRRLAGTSGCEPMVEGPSRESPVCPRGLRVIIQNVERLFIVDDGVNGGGALFRIDSPGFNDPDTLLLAGGGGEDCEPLSSDIDAFGAGFCGPVSPGLTSDLEAYLPQANGTILRFKDSDSTLTRVAGSGSGAAPSLSGGPSLGVSMGALGPGIFDDDVLYFLDPEVGQARALAIEEGAESGVITPFAGRLPEGYLEAGQYDALFRGPSGMAAGVEGEELALYIVDGGNSVLRKLVNGETSLLVGTPGVDAFGGDQGPASLATLRGPKKVARGEDGTLYILTEGRIRRVKDGIITTVAGNGESGYNGDVIPGVEALLGAPSDIALSQDGASLYIADTENHRVRRLRLDGALPTIETVLGNGDVGRLVAGASPKETAMGRPLAVAIRGDSLYVAQDTSWAVARVPLTPGGTVEILAAERGEYGAGVTEVLPIEGEPQSLFADPFGALFIASSEDRIYRWEGGVMDVVIGEAGQDQYNADGGSLPGIFIDVTPGLSMVMDSQGVLYITDEGQGVLRSLTF